MMPTSGCSAARAAICEAVTRAVHSIRSGHRALPSRLQPFNECLCHGVRLFERREMATIGDHNQARSSNASSNLMRQFWRRRLVALAD